MPDPVREETGGGALRLRIVERVLRAERYDARNSATTEVAAALLAELDATDAASASSSKDEGGGPDWRHDPEALSGLIAYALDANHGRPSFAVARAVVDELARHGALPAPPCAKCDRSGHDRCVDTACPRGSVAAPSVSQQGTGERGRERAYEAAEEWYGTDDALVQQHPEQHRALLREAVDAALNVAGYTGPLTPPSGPSLQEGGGAIDLCALAGCRVLVGRAVAREIAQRLPDGASDIDCSGVDVADPSFWSELLRHQPGSNLTRLNLTGLNLDVAEAFLMADRHERKRAAKRSEAHSG